VPVVGSKPCRPQSFNVGLLELAALLPPRVDPCVAHAVALRYLRDGAASRGLRPGALRLPPRGTSDQTYYRWKRVHGGIPRVKPAS
jgi:hypothetical protein